MGLDNPYRPHSEADVSKPTLPQSQDDQRIPPELIDAYVDRLIRLARARISRKLARRVDAEDVVQSALRSFFRGANNGRWHFQQQQDVWRLLARITLRKVQAHVKHHKAQKRSVDAEQSHGPGGEGAQIAAARAVAREPSPEDACMVIDELRQVLELLPPLFQRVLELRLRGQTTDQVAQTAQCSERTVYRACERCKQLLEERLQTELR